MRNDLSGFPKALEWGAPLEAQSRKFGWAAMSG
jgi:hypothetical protein